MNYQRYTFSKAEWMRVIAISNFLCAIISYLFYNSVFGMILLPLIIAGVYMVEKKKAIAIRKAQITLQFKDAILSVSAALRSGYSPERAFKEAIRDMLMNYSKDAEMVKELYGFQRKLASNMLLEDILLDFAQRSDIEDIKDFAQVFAIAKRKGGDISRIIQNTVSVIGEKIEVRQEIQTLLTAKQFEQTIMNLIPLLIIFYIRTTTPHFFDVLYHNLFGAAFMTGCLAVYAVAYFISQKIIQIEV